LRQYFSRLAPLRSAVRASTVVGFVCVDGPASPPRACVAMAAAGWSTWWARPRSSDGRGHTPYSFPRLLEMCPSARRVRAWAYVPALGSLDTRAFARRASDLPPDAAGLRLRALAPPGLPSTSLTTEPLQSPALEMLFVDLVRGAHYKYSLLSRTAWPRLRLRRPLRRLPPRPPSPRRMRWVGTICDTSFIAEINARSGRSSAARAASRAAADSSGSWDQAARGRPPR